MFYLYSENNDFTKSQLVKYKEGYNRFIHDLKNDISNEGKNPFRRSSFAYMGHDDARTKLLKLQFDGWTWDKIKEHMDSI